MSKNDRTSITAKEFMDELLALSPRLGHPPAFPGRDRPWPCDAPCWPRAVPSLLPRRAYAAGELGDTLNFTTWPNYFAQENFDKFTAETGVNINVTVFGSNEEMLAKLQAGGTGWDVFVPTNYTISTYKDLDIIEPLDLARLPNFDPSTHDRALHRRRQRSTASIYAVPKDWGTTGYVVNTKQGDKAR